MRKSVAVYWVLLIGSLFLLGAMRIHILSELYEQGSSTPAPVAAWTDGLELLILLLLMIGLVVALDQPALPRLPTQATASDPDEATVRVRAPKHGASVKANIVVTTQPRPATDDSSEFELTLDHG